MTSPHSLTSQISRLHISLENDLPLVSIVLATYNGEKFLEKQLDSLFLQSYPNIEVVAVDDGSSDKTIEILQEYAVKYTNMKVVLNKENLGFIKNFDKGCALASGQFIAPCDQDDYWDPLKIEKLVKNIGSAPMIYCDSYICDENLNIKEKKISDKVNCINFFSCLQQCVYCRIYGHATLISKDVYKKATPFIVHIPHDWWLCYISTLMGEIKFLNEPLVYYRQHSSNAIGVVGEKRRQHQKQNKEKGAKLKIRNRVRSFYEICPEQLTEEKRVLHQLLTSYESFSLTNNVKRVLLFFKYFRYFLAPKKKSLIMQYLFCLKMFVKIK
jgi:glycosyltransferase involved in cell wall biosynthesis